MLAEGNNFLQCESSIHVYRCLILSWYSFIYIHSYIVNITMNLQLKDNINSFSWSSQEEKEPLCMLMEYLLVIENINVHH